MDYNFLKIVLRIDLIIFPPAREHVLERVIVLYITLTKESIMQMILTFGLCKMNFHTINMNFKIFKYYAHNIYNCFANSKKNHYIESNSARINLNHYLTGGLKRAKQLTVLFLDSLTY